MRWVICTLFVLAFVPRASADDFDVLRGSQPVGPATFTRWSGIYAGGQFSYGQAAANFANATAPLVAFASAIPRWSNRPHHHSGRCSVGTPATHSVAAVSLATTRNGRICVGALRSLLLLANFGPTVEDVYVRRVREPTRNEDKGAPGALDIPHSDGLEHSVARACCRMWSQVVENKNRVSSGTLNRGYWGAGHLAIARVWRRLRSSNPARQRSGPRTPRRTAAIHALEAASISVVRSVTATAPPIFPGQPSRYLPSASVPQPLRSRSSPLPSRCSAKAQATPWVAVPFSATTRSGKTLLSASKGPMRIRT